MPTEYQQSTDKQPRKRSKTKRCGVTILADGSTEPLPAGGPCNDCGRPVGAEGGHAGIDGDSIRLLCVRCCKYCEAPDGLADAAPIPDPAPPISGPSIEPLSPAAAARHSLYLLAANEDLSKVDRCMAASLSHRPEWTSRLERLAGNLAWKHREHLPSDVANMLKEPE